MKELIFALAVFTCDCARAQPTFEKLWDCQGLWPLAMSELPSGNVLVNFQHGPGASIFDEQGDFVQLSNYWNDQLLGTIAIRQHSANKFYFASLFVTPDSCFAFFNQQYPAIGVMDSLGRVQ